MDILGLSWTMKLGVSFANPNLLLYEVTSLCILVAHRIPLRVRPTLAVRSMRATYALRNLTKFAANAGLSSRLASSKAPKSLDSNGSFSLASWENVKGVYQIRYEFCPEAPQNEWSSKVIMSHLVVSCPK
jgi:hypothetical protein